MATIINKNFHRKTLTGIKSGDTIENCNCTQQNINTDVCKGLKNLTIKNSNIRNCVFPVDTKFIGCKPYHAEIVIEPELTQAELANMELKMIQEQYGEIAKIEAKKVFNLKDSIGVI